MATGSAGTRAPARVLAPPPTRAGGRARRTSVARGVARRLTFVAPWGIPPERIIGSSTALTYQDDPDREPAYAAGAERVLEAARSEQGWAVISVKHDWSRVFADD
jgi:hypothetical protein